MMFQNGCLAKPLHWKKQKRRNFTARESRELAAIIVMVWEEERKSSHAMDGKVYRAANMLKMDAALDFMIQISAQLYLCG